MRYRLTGIAVAIALTVAFILTNPFAGKHFWHTVIPLGVGTAFIVFIVLESQRVKRKEARASDRHS